MPPIEWLTSLLLAMSQRPVQHQRADENGSQFRQHRRQFVAGIHARVVEHHPRGKDRCTDLHAQAADGLLAVRLGLHDGQDAANRAEEQDEVIPEIAFFHHFDGWGEKKNVFDPAHVFLAFKIKKWMGLSSNC